MLRVGSSFRASLLTLARNAPHRSNGVRISVTRINRSGRWRATKSQSKPGGWGGIRTPGTLRYTRFPGVHNRPLCHPSKRSTATVAAVSDRRINFSGAQRAPLHFDQLAPAAAPFQDLNFLPQFGYVAFGQHAPEIHVWINQTIPAENGPRVNHRVTADFGAITDDRAKFC